MTHEPGTGRLRVRPSGRAHEGIGSQESRRDHSKRPAELSGCRTLRTEQARRIALEADIAHVREPVAGCMLRRPLPGRVVGRVLGVKPCLSGAADSRPPDHMAFVVALRELQ